MRHFKRHILVWLFLLYRISSQASHVLGGELLYTHIKDNQYSVTLNLYRDCNGCKINGNGGGTSSEVCSEIEYLYVRGKDNSTSKETKFQLTRESITDISPICRSIVSACKTNSTSNFGIEVQKFTATIDLDNSNIKGFCEYYLYIDLAERNDDITTGPAKQYFCIDANIKSCLNANNTSAEFIIKPSFILNSNTSTYESFFSIDKDGDSLVYTLVPALTGIDKEVNYSTGFNATHPLTVYCTETPCTPNKNNEPPISYFFDGLTGETVFVPTKDGERGVVVVKVEEYRKISGKWKMLGYVKRDIQVYVKTSDGNNSPKFTNEIYYEICEGEPLEIRIDATDVKSNYSLLPDTVNFRLNSSLPGASFNQYRQSLAPFNSALFTWTPQKGMSEKEVYTFSISAIDNACPLNAISSQVITIKVKPKDKLEVGHKHLGCGNFQLTASALKNESRLSIKVLALDGTNKEIFNTSYPLDTISFLPFGKYLIYAKSSTLNGCETIYTDTIYNYSEKTKAIISGTDKICKDIEYTYELTDMLFSNANISWRFGSEYLGSDVLVKKSFNQNGVIQALVHINNGKWVCFDTLYKSITVQSSTEILGTSEIKVCHGSAEYDLSKVTKLMMPNTGKWFSSSPYFANEIVNTSAGYPFNDDTVSLSYKVIDNGCESSKGINLIIKSIPEFELSSMTVCNYVSPIQLTQLVKKPYDNLNYSYTWGLLQNAEYIKEENGYKVVYASDLGTGKHIYFAEITGANGCKNRDTAFIEITPSVKIKFNKSLVICEEAGETDLNKIGDVSPENGNWSFYDFDLITNKKYIKTDTCGQFELTYIYDHYGCYDSKKVKVTIHCKPNIQINGLKDIHCDSELPLHLSAIPIGGIWEGDHVVNGVFEPPIQNMNTDYSLRYKVLDNQCNFSKNHKINIVLSPKVLLKPTKNIYCDNDTISFWGSINKANQLTIKYLDNTLEKEIFDSQDFTNLKAFSAKYLPTGIQTWMVTATNSYGCETMSQGVINVYDSPIISNYSDTIICEGASTLITPKIKYDGKEPLNYSWLLKDVEIDNNLILNCDKLSVGMHTLIFKAGNEYCKSSMPINLDMKALPKVDFMILPSTITSVLRPEFKFLNQSDPGLNLLWNFGSGLTNNTSKETNPTFAYSDTGNYAVTLSGTNAFGCSNTVIKNVTVTPDILIFIPNAFSPDNKGEEKNNAFGVTIGQYTSYSIQIFDRWGHKLFTSKNPKENWDGKSGNVMCNPDVYFYYIKVTGVTGQLYQYKGTITLIR